MRPQSGVIQPTVEPLAYRLSMQVKVTTIINVTFPSGTPSLILAMELRTSNKDHRGLAYFMRIHRLRPPGSKS